MAVKPHDMTKWLFVEVTRFGLKAVEVMTMRLFVEVTRCGLKTVVVI